jgi:hydrogenase maturation protease
VGARVIGCGNPDAGDDAVGLIVARAVRVRAPDDVEVVVTRDPLRVLDLLDGVDRVVVVDGVRSTDGVREPGDLVRAEADDDGLPASLRTSLSSHGLGIAETIGLVAAMGSASRIVFHGVEVGSVTAGTGLSAAVAAAVPAVTDAVLADVGAVG